MGGPVGAPKVLLGFEPAQYTVDLRAYGLHDELASVQPVLEPGLRWSVTRNISSSDPITPVEQHNIDHVIALLNEYELAIARRRHASNSTLPHRHHLFVVPLARHIEDVMLPAALQYLRAYRHLIDNADSVAVIVRQR